MKGAAEHGGGEGPGHGRAWGTPGQGLRPGLPAGAGTLSSAARGVAGRVGRWFMVSRCAARPGRRARARPAHVGRASEGPVPAAGQRGGWGSGRGSGEPETDRGTEIDSHAEQERQLPRERQGERTGESEREREVQTKKQRRRPESPGMI